MSKYNAKKVEYKSFVFDSKIECDYYQYLERNLGKGYDHIELQPKYELQPKFENFRSINYVADFALWKDGKLIEVIDVKGMPTPEAKLNQRYLDIKTEKYHSRGYVKRLNTQVKSG